MELADIVRSDWFIILNGTSGIFGLILSLFIIKYVYKINGSFNNENKSVNQEHSGKGDNKFSGNMK